ncbi:phosphomannomutase/phosphoglucomutase [Rudaea sp.]|uniref:phosphomannomutase/phosphoglucomutase n=1 Tax=Rudaea sp. TaxID=2136325 RepID=UPI0039C8F337
MLVGALLLWMLGGLFAWQAWLVQTEQGDAERIVALRDSDAEALGQLVDETRTRLRRVLASSAVTTPLAESWESGREAATQAAKKAMPELVAIDFHRPDISDVLSADFSKTGYARSAMLVQASRTHEPAPAQSAIGEGAKRALVFALPVTRENETLAYAYASLSFEPVLAAFRKFEPGAGRLELRQGTGASDTVLATSGSVVDGTPDNIGKQVVNSLFRVASMPPTPPIMLPRSTLLLGVLALLSLASGVMMFYARLVGWRVAFDSMLRRKQAESLATMEEAPKEPVPMSPAPAAAKPTKPAPVEEQDVHVSRSMFRAYDIRGVLGKTLNADVARLIGRAIGSEMASRGLKTIAVGRDGRLSGPSLSAALIDGLRSTGADVTDIGAAPTPVLYFATQHLNLGSGVMVTGSHNPPDYNGFKIVLGGETLAEDAIQKLYKRIADKDFATGTGQLEKRNLNADYIERIAGDVRLHRPLKIVVDCGNGIPGAIAPQLFERLGADVVPLFCEVDGNFPNHHPDPSDLHNLEDLILTVKQIKADLGIAFDGDGDRLGVVTPSGEVIFPDRTLMLFARDVLTRNKGATIIYDVKCTGKLAPVIEKAGGVPLMWRTGHSLIKGKMRETGAALAGEMSGHFFFKERWYGFDDGLYAGARLLEILSGDAQQRAPQAIFEELPNSISTPELKIELTEGEHYKFIERFQKEAKFEGARINTIDGVRADWPDGWGLVRASNTTPVLVLRFDAESMEALKRVQNLFRAQLLAINPKLKLPF